MQQTEGALKYKSIYQYFVDRIRSGEFKECVKLPSEDEICSLFGVSRITVRKAMGELVSTGYIQKRHSKGAFVRAGVATMHLDALQGFSEEMRQRGLEPSTRVLQISRLDADTHVASKLNISEGTQVYCLERLRLANGEPMSIERLYVPYFLLPDLDRYDLSQPFYGLIRDVYHLTIKKAEQTITAGLANKSESKLLSINLRAPVLNIERVTYLLNNTPMEYVRSVYRGDKYEFTTVMNRNTTE